MSAQAEQAAAAARPAAARIPVKGRDCWWTVLVIDPLAAPLVRALAPVRRVTPNLLTAAAVAIGLAAAAAYAVDLLVLGALLFQLSFLLDCMDGKLAHARGIRNRFGPFLDAVGDGVRFASCTAGLVFALASHQSTSRGWVVVLAMFPTLHYVRLSTQAAWPDSPRSDPLVVPASPLAILRAAPLRLSKPATTVDTEAIAFTIGPIAGLPLECLAAAAAIDGARLTASLVARVWRSAGPGAAR